MFVTAAYAQDAGAAGGAGAALGSFLPLILIFAIMYFLLIRPQQKKVKELKAMIEALRKGDQVLTQGGIIGKIHRVGDDGQTDRRRRPLHVPTRSPKGPTPTCRDY